MKHALILILMLNWQAATAQDVKNVAEAARFIKLGNTLRMVDQSQQAIDLLLRALPAVQLKDFYLTAVAYENLGFAYNEQENTEEAVRYFQKALYLYQKLGFAASEAAMRQLIAETSGKNIYAGIDVGSSGVKLAIFRTTYENGFYAKDIRSKPQASNVTLIAGTEQSFRAGENVMNAYMDSISYYKIPADRVYIAFSSGINETMGKMPDRKKELYERFSSLITSRIPQGQTLTIDTTLTAAREAELFMVGAVPRKFWATTACIDIGSGNTKGGYYEPNPGRADYTFHPVSFPYGTKTLANLIDNNRSLAMDAYREEAMRFVKTIVDTAVNVEFDATSPGWYQRKTVGFGGGIVWAMASYLHPERAANTAVPLTMSDVERFKQLALTDYQALTHPDLTNLTDPVVRRKAEADISNVQAQFNEKQIVAGALLIETIFRAHANTSVPKRFVFIRDSDIGWVTGKFLESLNRNYERAVADGAR